MVPHSVRWRRASHRLGRHSGLIHPAPALAVTALSGALALILAREGPGPIDLAAVALVTAGVAGSQVFTGATNDLADQARDAILRPGEATPRR